jgi:ATP phosphoribosyltransferase
MPKKPVQPQDKYVLRLPDGLRDQIKEAAETYNRSMNAEIIARLEQAYANWPRIRLPRELLRRIEEAMTPEEMSQIEDDIARSVRGQLTKMFPQKTIVEMTEESFVNILKIVPEEDQSELYDEFQALMVKLRVSIDKKIPF